MRRKNSATSLVLMSLVATLVATAPAVQAAGKTSPALAKAARTLKANELSALQFSGTGSWYQFGQAPAPGLAWPQFTVTNYQATVDYAAGAARVLSTRIQVVEPERARPVPVEQKNDQYVSGDRAWNLPVADAGATANPTVQPAALEERRAEIWSTPQGFIRAALANGAKVSGASEETTVSFTANGRYRYEGTLNAAGEVTRVRTWIDNPVLGDTLAETVYSDYQDFSGVYFPQHIVRALGGAVVLDLKVTDASAGRPGSVAVPANLPAAAPAIEVKVAALAPGVWYLTGGTHHSVLIEQTDHLVVIEGPQNEARSLAVIAKAKETVPGKPIKYLINTHSHFDHSGGVRTYVDEGAIIVTDAANRAFYDQAWSAPRRLNPDKLAVSRKAARFETFTEKHVLTDGKRSIEIHPIAGSGHNDAFSLVYLPAEKILVEADAYTPTAAGTPSGTNQTGAPNPYTLNLAQNVQRLGLDVAQIAALHGPRVATLDDLRVAAGLPRVVPPTTSGVVARDVPGVVKAGTVIELVKQGFDGTEGPLPLPDGSLLFTENRADRIQRIADDGGAAVFLEKSGNPNALARSPDGSIVAAQTAKAGIGVIYPADKARLLADSFEGKPLNRPNDLIVDRGGGVWFTDPGAGPAQRPAGATAAAAPIPAVYYLPAKTSAGDGLRRLTTDIARPNGITLSPDEKTLYVANTYGEHVVAYHVSKNGEASRRRDFAQLAGYQQTDNGPSSGADGLAVDSAGRLYVASTAGVQVFDARGKALGVIELPNPPQNLAFAGTDRRTLYVVGRGAVWKIRTQAQGPKNRAK